MREESNLTTIGTSNGADVYFKKHCVTKTITEKSLVKSGNKITEFLIVVREIQYLPIPKNSKEAFEHLKNWSGQKAFEQMCRSFIEYNGKSLTVELLLTELQCINEFIKEAKKSSTYEAFASNYHQTTSKDNPYHEYLRIYKGFYLDTECVYSLNGITARVYAEYFLFKKWLEDQLKNIQEDQESATKQSAVGKSKPKVVVIALYYYYLQETGVIPYFENHINGKARALNDIALENDISAKRLQLKYNFIQNSAQNRIAANQIENIREVITLLQDHTKALELAKKELALAEKR